jgi:hypothetical protein
MCRHLSNFIQQHIFDRTHTTIQNMKQEATHIITHLRDRERKKENRERKKENRERKKERERNGVWTRWTYK